MKITLEVPDDTKAIVVTTIFGDVLGGLLMNMTNIATKELKDGAVIDIVPEVSDEE